MGWQRIRAWAWPALLSRILAAILGGYALGAMVAIAGALLLPMERSEAVVTGMAFSFLAYAGAVIWVFAARTALRAWAGVVAPALLLALASYLGQAG